MVANNVLRRLSENKQELVKQEMIKLFRRDPELGYAALVKAIEKAEPKDKPALVEMLLELGGKALKQPAVIANQAAQ